MSQRSAKHRKPRAQPVRIRSHATHRKPSPFAAAIQLNPTRTAVTVTGAVLIATAATPAVIHLPGLASQPSSQGQPAALGQAGAGARLLGPHGRPGTATPRDHDGARSSRPSAGGDRPAGRPGKAAAATPKAPSTASKRHHRQHAAPSVYGDPLRDISGLVAERIDQGVDFAGSGPIYAIGDAVVTNATGTSYGWPGGGWITYRLTNGPAAGLTVFVAEDVRPTVSVGQVVNPDTVIADMFAGSDGIETGWAMASGLTAESQLPEAGGIGGGGPFPTQVGSNFDQLLTDLGVPAANNSQDYAYGILPRQYPSDWAPALGAG